MREQTKLKAEVVLDFVNEHITKNGYPPSVREICAALGYKSTSTAHIYLKALEREGKIVKSPSKPRTLRIVQTSEDSQTKKNTRDHVIKREKSAQGQYSTIPSPYISDAKPGAKIHSRGIHPSVNNEEAIYVPVVGRVTAGRPILAVENIEYTFPIPAFFSNGADAFMLKVEGDSMINAGINDRDYLLIRRQPTAQNGDIVVALIDDEATVKTFYKERNRIRLQPENERYSPIYVTNNCTVIGKVIGIFRKL